MSGPGAGRPERVLAQAIGSLPGGLAAMPATSADVRDVVAIIRSVELAGCGHSDANEVEIAEELGGPNCRWGAGGVVVRRGADTVAAVLSVDGLDQGRGWDFDLFVRPGDPQAPAMIDALIEGCLEEGRVRWALLGDARPVDREHATTTRSFCFANDAPLRAALEARGFAEKRRYWRMRIDHGAGSGGPVARQASAPGLEADGYSVEVAGVDEATQREIHAVSNQAFADHFDSTPLEFGAWLALMTGPTYAPDQWRVARNDGAIIGFALGSNRYADVGSGYLASLAVLAEHRGRGVASTLLRAGFAGDLARGLRSSTLHCDAENTTGATRIYRGVGMRVDQEFIALHRHLPA